MSTPTRPARKRSVRCGQAERHGRRWRVAEIDAAGQRTHIYFTGETTGGDAELEARQYVLAFRSQTGERTVASALTEYLDHLARYGGSKRRPMGAASLRSQRTKLMGILQLYAPEHRAKNRGKRVPLDLPMIDRPISSLTETAAAKLYAARVKAVAADTQRGELAYANAFGAWCVERGYLRDNPFQYILPEGELSKGKAQLRLDGARAFIQAAYADEHPIAGIAAATVLTLGVRSNEALDRVVGDLDDNGRILWIPFGKTANARRRYALPPVLRSALLKLAEGRAPTELLFGTMTDGTLLKHVARLCAVAGQPVITTHGLRGTQISLTIEVAASVDAAAKAAGHANSGVTRAHYLAAGVEASARARLMEEILLESRVNATEIEAAAAELKAAQEKLERLRAGSTSVGYTAIPSVPKHSETDTN